MSVVGNRLDIRNPFVTHGIFQIAWGGLLLVLLVWFGFGESDRLRDTQFVQTMFQNAGMAPMLSMLIGPEECSALCIEVQRSGVRAVGERAAKPGATSPAFCRRAVGPEARTRHRPGWSLPGRPGAGGGWRGP